jgi:hypothetical protein
LSLAVGVFNLMSMDAQLVETFSDGDVKAEVYSLSLPGEFQVVYRDAGGQVLEETTLAGISTYKQREPEIRTRLSELAHDRPRAGTPDAKAAGER